MKSNNWKTYRLDELFEISSGLSKGKEDFGFGDEFLSFKDVFKNYFIPEKLDQFVNSTEKEQLKCSIQRGDVFLTRTSETMDELGMSSVALKDYPSATFNGFTKRLRLKSTQLNILHPEFAGFLFRSNIFRNQITSMSSMSTRASLNNEMISRILVTLPSMDEQKAIADVLYTINQKKDINDKEISILEKMSTTLFKNWFIDFEFPNEEGQSYKSSGGEMIESELGIIPAHFQVSYLESIAEIIMGQSPKGDTYNQDSEGLPLINGATDFKNGLITPGKYTIEPKKISQENDYIFGVRATIGNVTSVDKEYAIGRGAGIARSKVNVNREFLYFILVDAFKGFSQTSTGSVYLNVSRNDLSKLKILIPEDTELEKFHDLINPFFIKINKLRSESKRLEDLRDILLPKLLSGEIEVPVEVKSSLP